MELAIFTTLLQQVLLSDCKGIIETKQTPSHTMLVSETNQSNKITSYSSNTSNLYENVDTNSKWNYVVTEKNQTIMSFDENYTSLPLRTYEKNKHEPESNDTLQNLNSDGKEFRCKEEGLFPELNGNCNYYFSCNLIKDHLEKRSLHCSSSRYFSPQTNMCEFCLLSKQMCCNIYSPTASKLDLLNTMNTKNSVTHIIYVLLVTSVSLSAVFIMGLMYGFVLKYKISRLDEDHQSLIADTEGHVLEQDTQTSDIDTEIQ